MSDYICPVCGAHLTWLDSIFEQDEEIVGCSQCITSRAPDDREYHNEEDDYEPDYDTVHGFVPPDPWEDL